MATNTMIVSGRTTTSLGLIDSDALVLDSNTAMVGAGGDTTDMIVLGFLAGDPGQPDENEGSPSLPVYLPLSPAVPSKPEAIRGDEDNASHYTIASVGGSIDVGGIALAEGTWPLLSTRDMGVTLGMLVTSTIVGGPPPVNLNSGTAATNITDQLTATSSAAAVLNLDIGASGDTRAIGGIGAVPNAASGDAVGALNAAVVTGTFVQLGPSPSSGWQWGTASGAVQAIVTKPGDANTMWIGATDGGIWVTHDGGASWTPLTDKQASLSIGSLNLDPTDATHNTLLAGIGRTSNGGVSPFVIRGGQQTGLLYSTNGGTTWTSLGSANLTGQNITGVIARGQTMLAASFDELDVADGAGALYRSTNGGTSFAQVTSGSGLGTGPISSLVGDPANNSKLYAAVTSITSFASTAVYVSSDTGATWTQIFGAAQSGGTISAANQTFCRVAVNGSEIAVGVVHVDPSNDFNCVLAGLFLSTNSGATWTSLTVPSINAGGQAFSNFAIALDPTAAGVVYVTGDRITNSPFTLTAYMVTTSGATSITDGNTKNNTTAHADSRVIAFDANGRLILGEDGGIYARSNPTSTTNGDWSALNGSNLSIEEPYAVAFDGNSDRLLIAAQDNGTAFESSPGAQAFTAVGGGDGVNAALNDQISGSSNTALYFSSQSLGGLTRRIVNSSGTVLGQASVSFNLSLSDIEFTSSFVLNSIDPSRIIIHTQDVYVAQDKTLNNTSATTDVLVVTDIGSAGALTPAVAYGTQDNVQAVLAAGYDASFVPKLFLSTATTPASGSLTAVSAYPGTYPSGVAFDLRTEARFFVVDFSNLYATVNTGGSFTNLTSNLTALNLIDPLSVTFISANGVNELLVGGLNSVANAQSPIAVADSDSSGNLSNWRLFGNGLPNTYVSTLNYDVKSDTLAVGMFGRGGWLEYDVTSNFSTASVLQFGLANNNSAPDVSLLTGSRPLVKYGTGTLTISGAATYTGGSTVNGGAMQISDGASVSGTITFGSTSGSLGLANDSGFANALSGLHVGASGAKTNFIDIEGHTVTLSSVSGQGTTSGTITLSDGVVLHLANLSSTKWFANAVSDGSGGTDVFVSDTACYCQGTLILTDRGEVPVEVLGIGARLVTRDGSSKPLKWIGRRSYVGWLAAGNPKVMPICFKAGSLADGVPRRELWVSPEHAMYLDGLLVPAELLVNGSSIIKAEAVDEVHYFHLELEEHDVILAEGAWAESFIDDDSRGMFHNAAEFHALYPEAGHLPALYCAPRVEDGFELEALRRKLAGRANRLRPDGTAPTATLQGNLETVTHHRISGWARDPASPDQPVTLVVLADGAEIGRIIADRYRRDLQDAGIGDGRHAFELAIPGGLAAGWPHRIEVCRADDGTPVPGSPRVLVAVAAA